MNDSREDEEPFNVQYLSAMSRIPDPVFVVTTQHQSNYFGFTATSFTSVSSKPPTISVCINNSSKQAFAFQEAKSICVNLLGKEHRAIADLFSGRTNSENRFLDAANKELVTGSPALEASLISFDCDVISRSSIATHTILFGKVVAIEFDPTSTSMDALIYGDRDYLSLRGKLDQATPIKTKISREAIKSRASYLL